MVGAAIAEEDDVGDALIVQEGAEEVTPVGELAAVVNGSWPPPEEPIAAADVDPMHRVAALGYCVSQTRPERRCKSLQEKEGTLRPNTCGHQTPRTAAEVV
jgi:hypothetical protein